MSELREIAGWIKLPVGERNNLNIEIEKYLSAHTIQVLEELKSEYHKEYQLVAKDLGVLRETPHTIFHTLIDQKIKEQKK